MNVYSKFIFLVLTHQVRVTSRGTKFSAYSRIKIVATTANGQVSCAGDHAPEVSGLSCRAMTDTCAARPDEARTSHYICSGKPAEHNSAGAAWKVNIGTTKQKQHYGVCVCTAEKGGCAQRQDWEPLPQKIEIGGFDQGMNVKTHHHSLNNKFY